MKLFLYFGLFIFSGCATKYLVPGNRFMTPETQGGVFNGQAEMHFTSANQMVIDVSTGTADQGVMYESMPRTGFLMATSFLDELDLFWSHTGAANSMLGAKFQFMGGSKSGRETGHKMALAAAFGGNEHITDADPEIQFTLSGQELMLLYGYRFTENFLVYLNASHANYAFDGKITTGPLAGLRPSMKTQVLAGYAGLELTYGRVLAKLECGYQQLASSNTQPFTALHYGYSLGFSW
jgi:hypothetical protein